VRDRRAQGGGMGVGGVHERRLDGIEEDFPAESLLNDDFHRDSAFAQILLALRVYCNSIVVANMG
jgi:hypothetical protein